ncbi:MAG: 2'-5' RNA ligase family protein [Ignavibacteria bacterium]|jgi:2'-5' RNA ligase|nr:2'-5' RNA ligase family protein [Ignavibacteria bacterium]
MKLLAVAYPELSEKDYDLIEKYRREHDSLYDIIRTHFTLVFPVRDFSEKIFTEEIKKQLQGIQPFSFTLRSATINKDAFTENYYAFLVPDEGHSNIIKLHDKLYSGRLSPYHRMDIDFIPHITIGNSINISACKKMVDDWNSNDFEITGRISSIDIVNYEGATTLKKINLK